MESLRAGGSLSKKNRPFCDGLDSGGISCAPLVADSRLLFDFALELHFELDGYLKTGEPAEVQDSEGLGLGLVGGMTHQVGIFSEYGVGRRVALGWLPTKATTEDSRECGGL